MSIFSQILADTIRSGGGLIFLKDQAPTDLDERFRILRQELSEGVSFCVRSKDELLNAKNMSRTQDLNIFFEGQRSLIQELNKTLSGQRLLLAQGPPTDLEKYLLDFSSDEVSLQDWQQNIAGTRNLLDRPQKSFENSYRSPCLFLDRDDVLVKNVPYNKDPHLVELIPGAVDLIKAAHQNGYWVALVTNQSGLGRGLIDWEQYRQVHQRMLQLLAAQGAWLDECVWSTYIESSSIDEGRLFASLRKPRAGMFLEVTTKLKIDLDRSIMVGDSATDLIAAFSAGVENLYLLKSSKYATEVAELEKFSRDCGGLRYSVLESLSNLRLI